VIVFYWNYAELNSLKPFTAKLNINKGDFIMNLETQERILKVKKLRLKLADRCRNLTDGKRG
jgi:hypothetical protein